jgi:hypothetical protein
MNTKLFLCLMAVILLFVSCEKKENDKLEPLENIVVGKTDYPGCKYQDYEPDLVYTVDIDLYDSVNNQNSESFEYAGVAGLSLGMYNYYENKTLIKYLMVGYVGDECVARMTDNDTITRIFNYGDTLGTASNWVDESFCCHTDFAGMDFNYKTNTITYSYNADLKNAYAGFRRKSSEGYPIYAWIHFSLINLDTLIIHEAFSTPYIKSNN